MQFDPECVRTNQACVDPDEEVIPPGMCTFPFESDGKIHYQCVSGSDDGWFYYDPRDNSNRTSWCSNVPNFTTPCSAEAQVGALR